MPLLSVLDGRGFSFLITASYQALKARDDCGFTMLCVPNNYSSLAKISPDLWTIFPQ
jgi:hypothetical protein